MVISVRTIIFAEHNIVNLSPLSLEHTQRENKAKCGATVKKCGNYHSISVAA